MLNRRIRKIPGVREVSRDTWFGGIYIDNRPEHFFARFASDPEKIFLVQPEFKISPDQLQAFKSDRRGAAIGKTLAEKQNFKLGQRVTVKGDIYPVDVELTLRAIFEGPNDELMYFHREYLEEGLPTDRKGFVGTFGIVADSPESVPRIAQEVDEMFRNS